MKVQSLFGVLCVIWKEKVAGELKNKKGNRHSSQYLREMKSISRVIIVAAEMVLIML